MGALHMPLQTVTTMMINTDTLDNVHDNCKSSLGSSDKCRTASSDWLLTLRPSQPTLAVSVSEGSYRLHPPSLIAIYSFRSIGCARFNVPPNTL